MENDILYGQCWEDPKILFKAIRPSKGDLIISISSAGDNSLSLLQFPVKKFTRLITTPIKILYLL